MDVFFFCLSEKNNRSMLYGFEGEGFSTFAKHPVAVSRERSVACREMQIPGPPINMEPDVRGSL